MTILLNRDSNDVGNGFHAYYYSIRQEPASTPATAQPTTAISTTSSSVPSRALSCSGEYMHARISRAYLRSLGYGAWDVYLNSSGPFCMPHITWQYVVFDIPFSGCGTVRQKKNDSIIYSNIIMTSASGYIITRKRNFQFHIVCEMNENSVVQTMFVAQNSVDITERQHGHYNVTISFYESPSFHYQVYGSPYYVSLNQNLYLQATLHTSDPNLVLFLDTCVASPYPDDFTNLTYNLIRNGCVRDKTYRNLYSPKNNAVRFRFNAFKFLNEHNSVYLQCKLVVCRAADYTSRCYQGCLTRKKREAGELQEKVDVVLGPFKLQGEANGDRKQELVKSVSPEKDQVLSPLAVSTVLLAAMVLVLSGFLLSSKLRRKNGHQAN
ncbi:deleted in malignant brain tumors 1 protein-like [Varanus komodoensis]|uniref:deleted in malignant brain tumors 1 protein-like n=1 Tax=Varanus komodoensis TaxID=61221 RepID=UPI001CF79D68|nr:deleted in malignant brain tumors 1 protein-like [Varanus komodoensis]